MAKKRNKNKKPPQLSEQQIRKVVDGVYALMLEEMHHGRERQGLMWDKRYLSKRL